MKSKYIIAVLVFFNTFSAFSQEKKESFFKKHSFINMTEMGFLLGRNKIQNEIWWGQPNTMPVSYRVENRLNFTLQTFNGFYLNKKTAVGLTVGADAYGQTILMPISAGIRHHLVEKKQGGSILLGSLDAGYATTWLNEDPTDFKTIGGIIISPSIGYKLPMRNGSSWLINLGYRYQHAQYLQENLGEFTNFYESTESRNYRRLMLRFGIEF